MTKTRPASPNPLSADPFSGSALAALDEHADGKSTASGFERGASRMGRYHVLRLIGEGGMGSEYEAYDPHLDRKVAIKVPHAGQSIQLDEDRLAETRNRLIREAKSLAKLAHPNVIPIYDFGLLEDESIFLAMEFVPGATLDELLAAENGHGR